MPARPNHNHESVPIFQSPESDMTTADDLEPDGVTDVRVDCGCSRYSAETVFIPHRVVMEAVADPDADLKRLHLDPRIYATTLVRKEPGRPTRDFKPLHLHQVAATMRARRLLPFSPFTRNAAGLRMLATYADWMAKWEAVAELAPVEPAPAAEAPVLGVASFTSTTVLDRLEPSTVDLRQLLDLPASPPELGGYSTKLTASEVLLWVGQDPHRARHALEREHARTGKGPRASLAAALTALLAP